MKFPGKASSARIAAHRPAEGSPSRWARTFRKPNSLPTRWIGTVSAIRSCHGAINRLAGIDAASRASPIAYRHTTGRRTASSPSRTATSSVSTLWARPSSRARRFLRRAASTRGASSSGPTEDSPPMDWSDPSTAGVPPRASTITWNTFGPTSRPPKFARAPSVT